MNYYTNSTNNYSMNDRFDRYNDEYYYDNYSKHKDNDYCNKDYNRDRYSHKCSCVRRIEESFCCFPSYYNDEKEDKVYSKEKCLEGTFKICPKYYENNEKDNCNNKEDHKFGCKCHNRCNFCGLFRHW